MACSLQLDACSCFTGGLSVGVLNCNETDTGELLGCTFCGAQDSGGDSGGVFKPRMPSEV